MKPDNVLFADARGETVKLADFGLSAPVRAGEWLTAPVGTELYSAPEVFTDKYGPATDWPGWEATWRG